MTQILEKIKKETERQLSKKIAGLNDNLLGSANIGNKLFDEFKIQTPILLKDETSVAIGKEKVTVPDVPKGCSPGQIIDFVLFTIPIEGPYELFTQILNNYPWNNNLYHNDGKVYYKIQSELEITGNSALIENIRSKALVKFLEIIQLLSLFETEANNYNDTLSIPDSPFDPNVYDLKSIISAKLGEEKTKRESIKLTEEQLNPFV